MLDQHDYRTVVGPEPRGRRITYTCPGCGEERDRRTSRARDNNDAWFLSARCRCGQLALFARPTGEYLR